MTQIIKQDGTMEGLGSVWVLDANGRAKINAHLLDGLHADATGAADAHVVATNGDGNLLTQFIAQSTAVAARVYRSTNQTIGTGAATVVSFSHAPVDDRPAGVSAQWSDGAPTKLICRVPGPYIITAAIDFAANATGRRQLQIDVNGTSIARQFVNAMPSGNARLSTGRVWKLAVNDEVTISVYQDSGGDLDLVRSSNWSPELSWARVP